MKYELRHYGILGMRWGRRKGQSSSSSPPRNPSADHTRSANIRKKHMSEMSNEELRELAARMQLEKQYRDISKQELSQGAKFVNDIVYNSGKTVLTGFVTTGLTLAGTKLFEIGVNYAKKRLASRLGVNVP